MARTSVTSVAVEAGLWERVGARLNAPVRWLGRTRLRRRAAWGLVATAIVAGVVWYWGEGQLLVVPDVGDQFDVAAAATVRVPDERNAFVRYQEATTLLIRYKGKSKDTDEGRWSEVVPEVRAWAESNREALDYWREGTERPDAVYLQPRDLTPDTPLPVTQALHTFARLATLEGSRREEQGDMAGAWEWYRAILRSSRHSGQHSVMMGRIVGVALHDRAARELTRWAADPRTDAALLRRALAETIAIDARTVPESETLKVEYLMAMRALTDGSESWMKWISPSSARSQPEGWYFYVGPTRTAMLFLMRDRERSRRVARLFFANWLAHADQPRRARREAADLSNRAPLIYLADPASPPASRRLSPEEMIRAYESTYCARALLPTMDNFQRRLTQERIEQARLVVRLAEQLHLRERGRLPASVEGLVGAYLGRVPEDYQPEPPPAIAGHIAR